MKLIDKQEKLLQRLTKGPLTTEQLANALGSTNDAVRHNMRRLENREYARRITLSTRGMHWELTQTGRNVLDDNYT